jgi:hypothetical protein
VEALDNLREEGARRPDSRGDHRQAVGTHRQDSLKTPPRTRTATA